jgi:hypothetical protein
MKFRCAEGCKTKHKRIAVLDHCVETQHLVLVETTNRGRKSVIRGRVDRHEPAGASYDR